MSFSAALVAAILISILGFGPSLGVYPGVRGLYITVESGCRGCLAREVKDLLPLASACRLVAARIHLWPTVATAVILLMTHVRAGG